LWPGFFFCRAHRSVSAARHSRQSGDTLARFELHAAQTKRRTLLMAASGVERPVRVKLRRRRIVQTSPLLPKLQPQRARSRVSGWRQKLPGEDRDNKSIIFDSYSMSPLPLSVGR